MPLCMREREREPQKRLERGSGWEPQPERFGVWSHGRRTRQPARRELLVLLECGELPVPETLAGGREIASDPEPCDRE